MKKKQIRKQYGKEYRQSCVERALRIGNIATCARELNMNYGILYSWVNKAKGDNNMPAKKLSQQRDESQELQQLRKANARLQEENDILKKATAYFSQKELRKGTRS
jgi:transposase